MPVHYSVITSKRARRARRLSGCRIEPPSTSESRRLARRIESVLGSSEPRSSPQAGSVPSQSPTVNSTDALCTKSAMMSTWQQEANTAIQTGEVMENGNTATLNNTEAAPNSPPKPDLQSGVERSFQRRRSFSSRKRDVDDILNKHPHKIPIIIERARKEVNLNLLDKSKFLVPDELTMSQLTTIIRRRLQLTDTQAFYLIINRRTMVSASMTLAEVYRRDKDDDGFLYIVYASQEMFG